MLITLALYPTNSNTIPLRTVQEVSQHLRIYKPTQLLSLSGLPNQPLPLPLVIALGMFLGIQLLQENLGIQEAVDLVNGMYNMIQH